MHSVSPKEVCEPDACILFTKTAKSEPEHRIDRETGVADTDRACNKVLPESQAVPSSWGTLCVPGF